MTVTVIVIVIVIVFFYCSLSLSGDDAIVEGAGGTCGVLIDEDMPRGFLTLQRREILDARLMKDCPACSIP